MKSAQAYQNTDSQRLSQDHAYKEYEPCPELRSYIKCFWSYHSVVLISDPIKRIILPDGCLDIIFDFGADRMDPAFVIGAMTKPIFNQRNHLLGLRFQPGMAFCFLKTPLHLFKDLKVDLAAIWGPESKEIYRKLQEANLSGSLSLLTQALLKRLDRAPSPDQDILAAVALTKKTNGAMRVQQLSHKLGLSRQHLKRKCDQYIGLSPKTLLMTYRFNTLIKRVKSNPTAPWSRLAVDAGYYDQAHLIAEFKTMTGLTPSQYFAKKT